MKRLLHFITVLRKHRSYIRNNIPQSSDRPAVCFDLHRNSIRRYLYPLVHFFTARGFTVIIIARFRYISRLVDYEKLLTEKQNVFFTFRIPKGVSYYLTTSAKKACSHPRGVFIDPDCYTSRVHDDSHLLFPFPMHPLQYHTGAEEKLSVCTPDQRSNSIFFAGNCNPLHYDSSEMLKRFSIIPRFSVIRKILDHVPPDRILELDSRDIPIRERLVRDDVNNKVIICDIGKCSVPAEDWLAVLNGTTFFLALPGTAIPFCHNVIEAMRCGCIPILQYGNLFSPPLLQGKNSLHYHDTDSLLTMIDQALCMPLHMRETMQTAVLHYYEEYLSGNSFIERLQWTSEKKGFPVHVHINAERRSLQYFPVSQESVQ